MGLFPPSRRKPPCGFFEDLGVPLKTERGRRVFPQSDNAHDIADALARFAMGNGAALVQEPAVRVLVENDCVQGVETPRGQYRAQAVILACRRGLVPRHRL